MGHDVVQARQCALFLIGPRVAMLYVRARSAILPHHMRILCANAWVSMRVITTPFLLCYRLVASSGETPWKAWVKFDLSKKVSVLL